MLPYLSVVHSFDPSKWIALLDDYSAWHTNLNFQLEMFPVLLLVYMYWRMNDAKSCPITQNQLLLCLKGLKTGWLTGEKRENVERKEKKLYTWVMWVKILLLIYKITFKTPQKQRNLHFCHEKMKSQNTNWKTKKKISNEYANYSIYQY